MLQWLLTQLHALGCCLLAPGGQRACRGANANSALCSASRLAASSEECRRCTAVMNRAACSDAGAAGAPTASRTHAMGRPLCATAVSTVLRTRPMSSRKLGVPAAPAAHSMAQGVHVSSACESQGVPPMQLRARRALQHERGQRLHPRLLPDRSVRSASWLAMLPTTPSSSAFSRLAHSVPTTTSSSPA